MRIVLAVSLLVVALAMPTADATGVLDGCLAPPLPLGLGEPVRECKTHSGSAPCGAAESLFVEAEGASVVYADGGCAAQANQVFLGTSEGGSQNSVRWSSANAGASRDIVIFAGATYFEWQGSTGQTCSIDAVPLGTPLPQAPAPAQSVGGHTTCTPLADPPALPLNWGNILP